MQLLQEHGEQYAGNDAQYAWDDEQYAWDGQPKPLIPNTTLSNCTARSTYLPRRSPKTWKGQRTLVATTGKPIAMGAIS
jgi:hypothetical protein